MNNSGIIKFLLKLTVKKEKEKEKESLLEKAEMSQLLKELQEVNNACNRIISLLQNQQPKSKLESFTFPVITVNRIYSESFKG